ncbi:MAG: FG-GAP repeat domain-containing protein [Planctomycetota bacterium]
MIRITRMLLLAACGLLLLQTELPAQSSGFAFKDKTDKVGLSAGEMPTYIVQVFDFHITGAAWVDLTDDGYPDLILPANRNNTEQPQDQTGGGLFLVKNVSVMGGPGGRGYDFTNKVKIQGSEAHETVGVVAFDYDNDGDLDLLMICSGDPGVDSSSFVAKMAGMEALPPAPMRNVLLRNEGSSQNALPLFTDVTEDTDPVASNLPAKTGLGDGWGLAFTQAPSSIVMDPNFQDPQNDPNVENPAATTFPRSSACAAVADVNRDGLLDVFIGNSPPTSLGDRGYTGQMDALYLNGGPDPDNHWIFWDVTYDRRNYPTFFDNIPNEEVCPLVQWNGYLPVFGSQSEDQNFIMPEKEPWLRFSVTLAAAFTDLNNDGWPDLVVTNKGLIKHSVFAPAPRRILIPISEPGTDGWIRPTSTSTAGRPPTENGSVSGTAPGISSSTSRLSPGRSTRRMPPRWGSGSRITTTTAGTTTT